MVQVDLPAAFAAGQIFAIVSKKYLKTEPSRCSNRLTGPVTWYFVFIFAPVGMALLLGWPAWETMYWWEWVERPLYNPWVTFFYMGFYLSMVVIGYASYALAHGLYLRGRDGLVKKLAIVGLAGTVVPFILWPFTFFHVGTYAQYHAVPRETTTLLKTPDFFYFWLGVIIYILVGSVAFGYWLKKRTGNILSEA